MTDLVENQKEVNSLLDATPGGIKTIRDMTSFEFCQFCLSRLNNIRVDSYEVVNLIKFINNYNIDYKMSDEMKLDTIVKLKKLKVY